MEAFGWSDSDNLHQADTAAGYQVLLNNIMVFKASQSGRELKRTKLGWDQ